MRNGPDASAGALYKKLLVSTEGAEGLAKLAKDAAAIENISAGEALEKLLLAIEGGMSRGLRTMGIRKSNRRASPRRTSLPA